MPGMDPIVVVRQPVYYRSRPPGIIIPPGLLRSTWILANGAWTKVEDRASPPEQAIKFDRWVERACFQYHAADGTSLITSNPDTAKAAGAGVVRTLGLPQLAFSTDPLYFEARTNATTNPRSIHQCLYDARRMINTLVRIAHGGRQGISTVVIEDLFQHTASQRFNKKHAATIATKSDVWEWDGKSKLVRIHNVPRRNGLQNRNSRPTPGQPKIAGDTRETMSKHQIERMNSGLVRLSSISSMEKLMKG